MSFRNYSKISKDLLKIMHAAKGSYGHILKSSAILGSARVIKILIGMLRVKMMAILLGPGGVGLFGIYETISLMVATIAGMGVSRSSVRQIAQSAGNGDREHIARTTKTVMRVVWLLGIFGTLAMAFLSWPISNFTFESNEHAFPIMLLSITVLMITLSGGCESIMQGLGRIADLAKQNITGAGAGTLATIALLAIFKEKAIIPALLASYACLLAAAWWFVRKVDLPQTGITWAESLRETGPLVKLGLALMNAALLSSLVAYAAQMLIAREFGMGAVGIYLCAFSLSGKFVGFIIDAMWTDFYPRASSVANDHIALNRVVNEQTEIALLLAAPGLLATLVSAPWLIRLFYTGAFGEATLLLRWFTLGCLGGVICGPLRIVQLAKGKSLLCFLTETVTSGLHITMIFVLLKLFSLPGSAIAYAVHNLAQTLLSLMVANRLTGFKWSPSTDKMLCILVPIAAFAFFATLLLTELQTTILGGMGTVGVSVYCLRQLIERLGPEHRLSQFVARSPIIRCLLGGQ